MIYEQFWDQLKYVRGHTGWHLEIRILTFWCPFRLALLNGPAESLLRHYSISRSKRKSRCMFGLIFQYKKSHIQFANILINKYCLNNFTNFTCI